MNLHLITYTEIAPQGFPWWLGPADAPIQRHKARPNDVILGWTLGRISGLLKIVHTMKTQDGIKFTCASMQQLCSSGHGAGWAYKLTRHDYQRFPIRHITASCIYREQDHPD